MAMQLPMIPQSALAHIESVCLQPRYTRAITPLGGEAEGAPITIAHLPEKPLQLLHGLHDAITRLAAGIRQLVYQQGAFTSETHSQTGAVLPNLENTMEGPSVCSSRRCCCA